MSRNTSKIDFSCTDDSINRILSANIVETQSKALRDSCCYNQNEDQFLILEKPLEVPAFPVHHTIDNRLPPDGYISIIRSISQYLMENCPSLAAGTRWYFDPANIHRPSYYRIVSYNNQNFLYLLIIDLTCHPLECELIEQGSNNRTHHYSTKRLYFECDFFPLSSLDEQNGMCTLHQIIPITWKGEAGQGYMMHGIWMDSDINKFFSKLILPPGKRNHPYYPITCKQHCISMNAYGQKNPELLHRISEYLAPALRDILADLQTMPFSELIPLFRQLKATVPVELGVRWESLEVTTYLNERDQKEYTVVF